MESFRCGHPRTPENSKPTGIGIGWVTCRFCSRVKNIVRKVEREQGHINAGRLPDGKWPKGWM